MNEEEMEGLPTGNKWKRIGVHPRHGINLPLSALHSKNSTGIGEFLDLLPLIDWCKEVGFEVIQLLPLNDSGSDPSPYNVISSCALNPLFLSLHALPLFGESLTELQKLTASQRIDYQKMENEKLAWLHRYFEKSGKTVIESEDFRKFVAANPWVAAYAKFKDEKEISFHEVLQYLCFKQLSQVKAYASSRHVLLQGDIPILVSSQSADVILHKESFNMALSVGSPPDPFNREGQYWGFPLYNWEFMKKNGYKWWKERLEYASNFYDLYRVDHAVGFYRIWAIPLHHQSKEGSFQPANDSHWIEEGEERLLMMIKASPMLPIAEDLGTVPGEVRKSLTKLGICGTKVMRWERYWEKDKRFIPFKDYPPLSVTTISTHDTETLELWWRDCPEEAEDFALFKNWHYTPKLSLDERKEILRDSHHTPSLFHINLLQEYLAFFPDLIWPNPEDERINVPGGILATNWTYRFRPSLEKLIAHADLKKMIKSILALLLVACLPLFSRTNEEALFRSLDPQSISQHLAFYELYPDCQQGQESLARAWKLLCEKEFHDKLSLPKIEIQPIISLVTRQSNAPPVKLPEEQLKTLQKICSHLPNRKLKGFHIWTKEEVLALPTEEIDLGRGILINQFETQDEILQYEASIDLMALQILARLPKNASAEDKIKEINHFIFEDMQFRFPPHSLYATDIDLYTFLPSVLDSRQGVCLGVSILYLCLSQRLDLPLEIITPPGHIYVRYKEKDALINIETTARGINLPSDVYLGINTRKLEERSMKEVIGMAFFNQASAYWGKQDYAKAAQLYEKALPFSPNDPLIKMLLGFNYLFIGKKQEAIKLLKPLEKLTLDHAVSPETMAADYLNGKVDAEGIKTIFLHVDEKRSSILEKQDKLKKVLAKYPSFRAGIVQLAITYLQLGRTGEALKILKKHHKLDPTDATVEYYLAVLSAERLDIPKAWHFLKNTETLAAARDHHPKSLKALRQQLKSYSPEP